jgi:hypothetical protein
MFEYTFVLWLAKRTKRGTKGRLRLVAQRLFSCFLIEAMHARLCIACGILRFYAILVVSPVHLYAAALAQKVGCDDLDSRRGTFGPHHFVKCHHTMNY